MNIESLIEKTKVVANKILATPSKPPKPEPSLSKKQILEHGVSEEEYGILRDVLCAIPTERFAKIPNNPGGLCRVYKKGSQNSLVALESKFIEQQVRVLYQESLKPKNEKPEKLVEDAFFKWLKENEKENFQIINSCSSQRKGTTWENIDGYSIKVEKLDYHLHFKPLLTSYEVKAELPDAKGVAQAKSYLEFSNFSYLVFKYLGTEEELKVALEDPKRKYDSHDGVGVYYTTDGETFKRLYESKPKSQPLPSVSDQYISKLLSPEDKNLLLKLKHDYVQDIMQSVLSRR
jgi:hypothetical protein